MKATDLGFEFHQWLVDTVDNIKGRVFGLMMMLQARVIIRDIEKCAEEEGMAGVTASTPSNEGTGWLSRLRLEWGVCEKAVTLVNKVSWAN